MIKFSIIIVSYNNVEILEECIKSIFRHNDIGNSLEVIIVDNSPNEDLYFYIKDKYKKILIIKNTNSGFGDGNNIGVSHSNGEYLLFLNPDTILVEPIFRFAINKFEENPEIGLFGVKLLDENMNDNLSYYFLKDKGIVNNQLLKIFNKMNLFIPNKMFISGANMFMRKSDFIKIGKFDNNFFMYMEERDLTMRLIKLKKKNAFYKDKSIIHLEGQSSDKGSKSFRIQLDSLKYFCEKYDMNYNEILNKKMKYLKRKRVLLKILKKNTITVNDEIKIVNQIINCNIEQIKLL